MPEPVLHLSRSLFTAEERTLLTAGPLTVRTFRYPSGVEALRFQNGRGEVIVLPYLGQMIWRAVMGGVELGMASPFAIPQPAPDILGTYGCLCYHSGLLRNGVPGPEDDHPVHGEFPTLALDEASLLLAEGEGGVTLRLLGEVTYLRAFGPHYRACAHFVFGEDTLFETGIEVENRAPRPMDLMYMCHANFAFVPEGRIHQPVPFTPERTVLRRAIPAHVRPDPEYLARLETWAAEPGRLAVLDPTLPYDPEIVFYLRDMPADAEGLTHALLERPEGDGFVLSYDPRVLPFAVRWLYSDGATAVAAFLLPATCEPEGYTAERRKGHVRTLAPGQRAAFRVRLGYLDPGRAAAYAARIASLAKA
jgi:hypothetical protein